MIVPVTVIVRVVAVDVLTETIVCKVSFMRAASCRRMHETGSGSKDVNEVKHCGCVE